MLEIVLAAFITVSNPPQYSAFYACLGALQAQSDIRNGNMLGGKIFPKHNENISAMFDTGEKMYNKKEQELGADIFVDAIGMYEDLDKPARKRLLRKCYGILSKIK